MSSFKYRENKDAEWEKVSLGVESFNGRAGNIAPREGDYTAEMVGARPVDWMPSAEEVGAAAEEHTHTAAEVGAAESTHTHTKSQITDFPTSMPASDVYSWAKASSKPSYTASEVGAVPTSRTVNGKALSANISLSASDVGALPLSGGTVTGPIQYQTPSKTITPLTVHEGDVNGAAIVIGGGGLTVVGGGESAANLYSTLNSPTSEEVHIAADTILNLHSNCQTVAKRKTVQLTAAGALVVPSGTDYTTAKSRNIKASTTDLTAGTSTLASGDIYLVYE